MPLYREDSFLIIHPGSQNTIFSFGLQDSLSPPQYKLPTVVYQDPITKEYKSNNEDDTENELIKINPIISSKVVDVDAFNYLLKVVLQSVISKHPIITINQIPLLLIAPTQTWPRTILESITKYVFESLELTAFNVLDLSIASTFSVGSTTNSLVVNVGANSSQIVPVLNYQSIKFASKYLPGIGGLNINDELKSLLPTTFTDEQIESLKCSDIYEVLNNTDGSFYSFSELNNEKEDEDEFDIAAIVAKEEKEKALNGDSKDDTKKSDDGEDVKMKDGEEKEEEEETRPNSELEKNFFIDAKTNEKVFVGKERFQGTSKLINELSDAIYKSLLLIPDLEKRQVCYDNLIFIGSTFNIKGLKQAILIRLVNEYLVKPPTDKSKTNDLDEIDTAIASYQQIDEIQDASLDSSLVQVPTTVKLVKLPEYFPEWKKPKERNGSWSDVYFLGGEIYSKQIFGANSNHGGDSFIDNDIYEERGPQAIWDVIL